jgi:hypothetical protein
MPDYRNRPPVDADPVDVVLDNLFGAGPVRGAVVSILFILAVPAAYLFAILVGSLIP